jgi:hypothetical protein
MSQVLLVALFALVMLANVFVLVRHWQMMRMMHFLLTNLIESQKQFNEIMEAEQRKRTP